MFFRNALFSTLAVSCSLAATGGAADAADRSLSLTLQLPLRNEASLDDLISLQGNPESPLYHHWLTPAQFRAAFGPAPSTIFAATAAIRRHGLHVFHIGSQLIHVSGSAANVERAFGTRLHAPRSSAARQPLVAETSSYRLPADLAATGARMLNLAEIPEQQPLAHLEHRLNRNGEPGPYWFDDLKQAYQYPAYERANGAGRTIAVISYGDYNPDDAAAYFNHERLGGANALAPAPAVAPVYVGGAAPVPFNPSDANDEEMDIDVQQAGGSAPGATIVPIKDNGPTQFVDGFEYAIDSNAIDILSISYANCELAFLYPVPNYEQNTALLDAYHDMFKQGNSQGITFVAGSGDDAGLQCGPTADYTNYAGTGEYAPVPSVASWADDPNVTAVGGTNLETTALPNRLGSKYVGESEYANELTQPQPDAYDNLLYPRYFGSGGGVSSFFKEPDYQKALGLRYSGRAVPDVSMQMGGCVHHTPSICKGNESAIEAYVGGEILRLIGTSASAPEFAGLLAVKEQITGQRFGNENYDLYLLGIVQKRTGFKFYHDGIPGNNGVITVPAGYHGYDEITGLGTPYGYRFAFDRDTVLAGDPQTATNP